LIVAVLVTDSLTAERRWRVVPLLAGAVASLIVAWFYLSVPGPPAQTFVKALTEPLSLPGVGGMEAVARLPQYRAHLAQLSRTALEPLVLAAAERGILADSTVDVYPWEVGYVAANQLNWANRPAPASHTAHSPILDRMDAAFFDSPRRPQRLLWHTTDTYLLRGSGVSGVASIDGRHVFWDEPLTLVSILNHYRLVSAGSVFVLKPRAEPRFISEKQIAAVTIPWGVWTSVPKTPDVVLAKILTRRPPWARVRSLLLREEEMSVDVRFSGQRMIHCRFIPDLAVNGLWISPLPHSAANLETLLSGGLPEQARVTEIRFWNGWAEAKAPDLRISWLTLETRGSGLVKPATTGGPVP
jgi:hypothetical protein